MEQYFAGRSEQKVSNIVVGNAHEDMIFVNERVDSTWDKAHLKIYNSTFAKMGFRDSKFKQCDLSFCVFIDCYFKKTFFEQSKFISCIFINCNFDMATFINCDFRYATFENCFISYHQMKNNLPHGQENLCADICRNLSMQCLNLGAIDDYKLYLFEERASGEIHEIKKLFHESNSYYSKYSLWEGIEGLLFFIRSKISKFLWGYGERMGALIRNILIVIFLYAIVYFFCGKDIVWNNWGQSSNMVSALYLSACNFFHVSTETLLNTRVLHIVKLSEHIIGLILMGFFGAALFRQINRR